MWSKPPSTKPNAHPQNEYCPVAIYNPLTGYEPNELDNFDYSETSAAIFIVDIDTEPSHLMQNSTMSLLEKRYLLQFSIRSEKNQRTCAPCTERDRARSCRRTSLLMSESTFFEQVGHRLSAPLSTTAGLTCNTLVLICKRGSVSTSK